MSRVNPSARHSSVLVRLYGDSLGLPRHSGGVLGRHTYAERLRDELTVERPDTDVRVFNRSRGGATVSELYRGYQQDDGYFGAAEAQILIIQCGICDCAPRPVPLSVRNGIARLPGPVRARVAHFLHNHRAVILSRGLVFRHTSPERFRRLLSQWLNRAAPGSLAVIVVNIAPATSAIDAHSPGLNDSIERYNALMLECVRRVPAANVVLADVHAAIKASAEPVETYVNETDGHHITSAGHALYASTLQAALRTTGFLALESTFA